MFFKYPQNDQRFIWTRHAIEKMKYYGLSEQKLRKLFYKHKREEEGIAPATIAIMNTVGSSKRPTEIWLMYQLTKDQKVKIITAWRYPGVSKKQEIPIPDDIMLTLQK
ncbi:hypothetical protein J7L24_01470 [bacterium]|nr:hypothetical protein [bacterium]OQX71426.1 MAG: hypothetical protein B6D52_01545 [Candidatus Parcubacteria bacterium 4484_255]